MLNQNDTTLFPLAKVTLFSNRKLHHPKAIKSCKAEYNEEKSTKMEFTFTSS